MMNYTLYTGKGGLLEKKLLASGGGFPCHSPLNLPLIDMDIYVRLCSVNELLKAKEQLTLERDAKLEEIASLRAKLSDVQQSEQKLEKERDEAHEKLQEVRLTGRSRLVSRCFRKSETACVVPTKKKQRAMTLPLEQ